MVVNGISFGVMTPLPNELIWNSSLAPASRSTLYQCYYILPLDWSYILELWAMGSWNVTGSDWVIIVIFVLKTHPVLSSATNVSDKSTPTEEIRTMDSQFQCPSALPNKLIGKFPLASRSTLYQYYRVMSLSWIVSTGRGYVSNTMTDIDLRWSIISGILAYLGKIHKRMWCVQDRRSWQKLHALSPWFGAICSSVVRAFAHGAMGRRIDPSWGGPIELCLVPAGAPRLA